MSTIHVVTRRAPNGSECPVAAFDFEPDAAQFIDDAVQISTCAGPADFDIHEVPINPKDTA